MHAIEFLKEPGKVSLRSVYAVFGDDAFLRQETLHAIQRAVLPGQEDDLSVAKFAGDTSSLSDVLDELHTLPFFSKRRLVVVEGADPFVSAHRKELETYVEHPSASGTLVLMVKLWPSNTRLAKLVDKVGLAVECKGPQDRLLAPWLVHLSASRFKTALDPAAAELLVELVGPEVGLLVREIEKLSVYVGTRAKIHRDDVARMVGAGRIETVWKTLDAATTGRGDLALEHLDGLITAGEHPVGLLAAMSASLLKVHHAGRLRGLRVELRDACGSVGIPPGAVEKTRQQHAHLGPSRVDGLPGLLVQADLDLKGASTLTPRVVLERLLVALSGPRRD
ncbi:MAG: DNA polymerase III subunit delta [Isosphaeraceae bacterium]